MTSEQRHPVTGVRTVGVPVTDQDRALDFYVGTLGMELRLDEPLPQIGGRWIEVGPAGGGTTVALIPAGDELPSGVETGIRLVTDDATALHRELTDAGVTVGELLLWDGIPPMFTVQDPDGNGLEIVE